MKIDRKVMGIGISAALVLAIASVLVVAQTGVAHPDQFGHEDIAHGDDHKDVVHSDSYEENHDRKGAVIHGEDHETYARMHGEDH